MTSATSITNTILEHVTRSGRPVADVARALLDLMPVLSDEAHAAYMIRTWAGTSPTAAEVATLVGYLVAGRPRAFSEALDFARESREQSVGECQRPCTVTACGLHPGHVSGQRSAEPCPVRATDLLSVEHA